MGFSSSSMFNSDKEKLKKFFDELELSQEDKEMAIILFVLGYIAADGCVKWIYAAAGYQDLEDGYTIQFDCATAFARDDFIMYWVKDLLEMCGISSRDEVSHQQIICKDCAKHTFSIRENDHNNNYIIKELTFLQRSKVPSPRKLLLLQKMLLSKNNKISNDLLLCINC